MRLHDGFLMTTCLLGGFVLSGCGSEGEPVATEPVAHEEHDHADGAHAAHDHSGWWCVEHGVPEDECALCDPSLVADFKAKGDWCEEHNRPDSQCFICHPENFDKFAMRYEAKFGEQPPAPTE
ncbi:RND transporter [Roseiconus nitratireducens]|uniref:RND transporter n=1 Tax=Roseiconus nitratireducens TaxID=2605748 RepID=UPI001F293F22|nr:RND transporter [Roseiconus nitratireducens]